MSSRIRLLGPPLLAAACAGLALLWNVFTHPEAVGPPIQMPDSMPRPVRRPFQAGEELAYELGWNGAPCADLHMSVREEEKDGATRLVISHEGHTRETLAVLWEYRMWGETYLDPQTLLPSWSTLTGEEKDEAKRFTMTFDRSAGVAHSVEEKLHKHTREEHEVPFRMGLDLIGAIFFARTLELPAGEPTVIEVLHNDKTYAAELTPLGLEKIQVKAGTFDALAVDVRVHAVGGTQEERVEEEAKFRKVCIWFSRDRWLPVKMESEVFVGSVYAELVSARP